MQRVKVQTSVIILIFNSSSSSSSKKLRRQRCRPPHWQMNHSDRVSPAATVSRLMTTHEPHRKWPTLSAVHTFCRRDAVPRDQFVSLCRHRVASLVLNGIRDDWRLLPTKNLVTGMFRTLEGSFVRSASRQTCELSHDQFLANVLRYVRYMLSAVRLSVCLSVCCLWRWCTLLRRLNFSAIFFTIR